MQIKTAKLQVSAILKVLIASYERNSDYYTINNFFQSFFCFLVLFSFSCFRVFLLSFVTISTCYSILVALAPVSLFEHADFWHVELLSKAFYFLPALFYLCYGTLFYRVVKALVKKTSTITIVAFYNRSCKTQYLSTEFS